MGAAETDREGPVLIEVRGVEKTFIIPDHKVDTLKERVAHPLTRAQFRELHALRGISFDVHEGEFFGIVGRNGSGKSTLLKILASIYRADRGTVRLAGRLAPFIELGVGFNPELAARENVALSGVLMGLTRRESARRLDAVLDFAGLREFADLRLKNYSSGMMVRLAFAAMVQADADVMLVDEVLAVGDAQFAQRCLDVFEDKRRAGKTLVLVTHDMATVQGFCDRALLLHDGEMEYEGDPEEAALRYFRRNFGGDEPGGTGGAVPDVNVRLHGVWLEDEDGQRVANVEQDKPLVIFLDAEAREDLVEPVFDFHVVDEDGNWVFGFTHAVEGSLPGRRVARGEHIRLTARVEHRLLRGRYFLECWMSRSRDSGDLGLHVMRLLDFLVYGTQGGTGTVSVEADVTLDVA